MGGLREGGGGGGGGAQEGQAPPHFSLDLLKKCNQPCFEWYCAIRVVLFLWGEVVISPNFFRSLLSKISGSYPKLLWP